MKMKNLADENRELRSSVSRLHLELEGMTGEKQSLARVSDDDDTIDVTLPLSLATVVMCRTRNPACIATSALFKEHYVNG